MKKLLPNFLYRLKWKLFYRKGYGVHSPFVYNLITQVIEEKTPFYVFAEIENLREEILKKDNMASLITDKEIPSPAVGMLLFRLMHYFECRTAIEIGSSTAIMGLYIASAQKQSICYLLEDRVGLMNLSRVYAREKGLNNINFVEEDYEKILKELHIIMNSTEDISSNCSNKTCKSNLIFINHLSDRIEAETIFPLLHPCMNSKTIWVINNIRKDEKTKQLWEKIREDTPVKTTLDLFHLGIAFFDKNLPQKYYREYFNYGKKPHLYKNR